MLSRADITKHKDNPTMKTKNKKALSEIVSYTLLIVVVLTIASLVYYFLKIHVPKEKDECPEELSLIIKDYTCSLTRISITLQNKGLFSINGSYIRGRCGKDAAPIRELYTTPLPNTLLPGEEKIIGGIQYNTNTIGCYTNLNEIEVEPFIIKAGKTANEHILCENAVIKQTVVCK